ncbi:hypothetical protein MKEN_00595400 [Mycena kentingensis (nom. inval.)]|nr:hypothetical protein MKEN_00595400 [Mycena kentingensis (nom. inval.)]
MSVANIAELVIRQHFFQITPEITTFSKPMSFLGFLHFGGRSTAVRLASGDVWVFASTPLTHDTKARIDTMGSCRWIIGSNAYHHMYLGGRSVFASVFYLPSSVFSNLFPRIAMAIRLRTPLLAKGKREASREKPPSSLRSLAPLLSFSYMTAKVIGVKALVEKKRKEGLELDGGAWFCFASLRPSPDERMLAGVLAYGVDAPGTKYGFEDEVRIERLPAAPSRVNVVIPDSNDRSQISACHFSGQSNEDVAFFHHPSKTLIQADLLFNLPCTEQLIKRKKSSPQYSKTASSGRIPLPVLGNISPTSGMHGFVMGLFAKDKVAMARDARTVLEWNPQRIIPADGDIIEKESTEMWRAAYKKFLA